MPEAAEVELVRASLQPLVGESLTGVQAFDPELRGVADLLIGRRVSTVRRSGKRLALVFGESALIIHLRMTGNLVLGTHEAPPAPTARAVLVFGALLLVFEDLRRLGSWTVDGPDAVGHGLGLDLLDSGEDEFWSAASSCSSRTRSAKSLMLDQSGPIAGAGNYLVDETLFIEGVHPLTAANVLSPARWISIWETCRRLARRSIAGRAFPLSEYIAPEGVRGLRDDQLVCYGRRGMECVVCASELLFTMVSARGTTYCPHCQQREVLQTEASAGGAQHPAETSNTKRLASETAIR